MDPKPRLVLSYTENYLAKPEQKKTGKLGRTHSQTQRNANRASIKDFALSGMNDVETL